MKHLIFFLLASILTTTSASAGQLSFGISFGFSNTDLKDLDGLIVSANGSASGPISTKALGNGLEIVGVFGYRFDGTIFGLHFAPSYYFNKTDGTNSAGAQFDYEVTALTAMPMFRLYALENDFMSLFFQFGVGWSQMYGQIIESADNTEFSGSNLGYQAGIGLQICYEDTHCLNFESNLRVLDIERSTVDDTTSAGTHTATGRITQSSSGSELEIDNRDLGVDLTGLQVLGGYVFRF